MTTDQEKDQLDRWLAERIGDAAWKAVGRCLAGHANVPEDGDPEPSPVGTMCWECLCAGLDYDPEEAEEPPCPDAQLLDPAWHPEWRIQRQPKSLTRSLDVLEPLLKAECRKRGWTYGWYLQILVDYDLPDYCGWVDTHNADLGEYMGILDGNADHPAEALALAWQAAMVAVEGVQDA